MVTETQNSPGVTIGSCSVRVESIVTVDDRGQMVLPKEVRDKLKLQGGDKLAIASCNDMEGNVSCLCLIKSDNFAQLVKDLLGPMMQEIMSS